MCKRSAAAAAIFALTMGLAACGDDGGSDYTIADVCDEQTGLFVEFFETALACQPELELFFGGYPGAAELSTACHEQFQPYVDDGTVVLSQVDADWETCLDFIANIDCATFGFDGVNPCEAVFGGQILTGEACEDETQCEGNSYCDDSANLACGTCQVRLNVDDTCDSGDQCTSGLCADADNTCQEPGIIGDACAGDDECAGRLECDVNSVCAAETVWADADACDSMDFGNQCGFPFTDLYCNQLDDTCTVYSAVGDVCGQGAGFCDIINYETCENGGQNATDECVAPIVVALGDNCGFQTGEQCAAGLVCVDDGVDETCVNEAIAGDICIDDCPGSLLLDCNDAGVCAYGNYTGECPVVAAAQ